MEKKIVATKAKTFSSCTEKPILVFKRQISNVRKQWFLTLLSLQKVRELYILFYYNDNVFEDTMILLNIMIL